MEEALKKIKGKVVVFGNLNLRDGYLDEFPLEYYNYQRFMPVKEFLEMLFDIIDNNIPINVDGIYIHTINHIDFELSKPISHIIIMDKYNAQVGYYGMFDHKKHGLATILDASLYAVLKNDYNRHKLRIDVKHLKNNIRTFIKTQSSFDDVSKFTRILDNIEKLM